MADRPNSLQALRLVHRALRYRFRLNPRQIRAMRGLLTRGGTALDIGAHKGAYSCWMAWSVGPSGRVLAFEPQDRLVDDTAAALRALGLRQVKLVHAAVSDHDGRGSIAIRRASTHGAALQGMSGEGIDQQPVEVITIDTAVEREALPGVDFIKIDVEGHELAVLRGAARTLERHRPPLLIELEARHHLGESPLRQAAALLAPLGYRGQFFSPQGPRSIAEFEDRQHQDYGRGAYCNDFLFTQVPRP